VKRVVIAPAFTSLALGALTFIAAGAVVTTGFLVAGADRVEITTRGDALTIRIGGLVGFALASLVTLFAVRQWIAIRLVEVADDGSWALVDRLGRRWQLATGTAIAVELRCRRVLFTWGGAPRMMDVVDGWVAASSRRRRLAGSGPVAYDRVVRALGLADRAPRRGERVALRRG
jgi:hypothetical protein